MELKDKAQRLTRIDRTAIILDGIESAVGESGRNAGKEIILDGIESVYSVTLYNSPGFDGIILDGIESSNRLADCRCNNRTIDNP